MQPLGLAAFLGFMALSASAVAATAADTCPQPGSEIATDRPDTTNSSLVVPQGSFQQENGVNISGRDGGQVFDGTNTRLRLGIAQCLEVLMDVPTYFDAISGRADSGFTNVTPAIKWQISPLPGKIDLSATFGARGSGGACRCDDRSSPGRRLPLVALMPQWRQDHPNKRPPTWATAISEMGHFRPPALQKNHRKNFAPRADALLGAARLLQAGSVEGRADAFYQSAAATIRWVCLWQCIN